MGARVGMCAVYRPRAPTKKHYPAEKMFVAYFADPLLVEIVDRSKQDTKRKATIFEGGRIF